MHIYGEAKERDLKQLPFSVPKFWHYRDGQTVFSSIAADWGNGYILTGLATPFRYWARTSPQIISICWAFVRFLAATFFHKKKCSDDVALITENFWRKRLSSDPGVLGRSIALNGVATTIVGVLPSLPISWFGRRHRSIHSQAVRKLERDERAHDAWLQLHALHRALEARRHHATSAVDDACLGAKLSHATSRDGGLHLDFGPGQRT